jgi:hypothetical protein
LIKKKIQLKKYKRKINNNHKNNGQVYIKIKFNQILRDEIEKKKFQTKYIKIKSLRIKFDIISK